MTCVGLAKHSQNLDDKVIFLINVLKQKNLEIEALKRKNVLLKSKVNGLMNFKLPKRMEPARKSHSKDEFLMLLMRLRLGLGEKDLSDLFKISPLTSNIIHSWLKRTADTWVNLSLFQIKKF